MNVSSRPKEVDCRFKLDKELLLTFLSGLGSLNKKKIFVYKYYTITLKWGEQLRFFLLSEWINDTKDNSSAITFCK